MTELHFEIEPITVRNPEREACRAVAMGRPEMMIRELVKNAEEAARKKPMGERQIRIYGTPIDGVTKLTIWNRGGMTLATLLDFANINVEIDKVNAMDQNYGRGAKIASLMSNQRGLRYRSCLNRRVLQVRLCVDVDQQVVGPIQVAAPIPGGGNCIEDVTETCRGDYDLLKRAGIQRDILTIDWTEVVLLGNEADQDTTQRPYLDAHLPAGEWLG